MNSLDKSKRANELGRKILEYKQLYYSGNAKISDHDYDALEAELKELDPNHPVLSMVGANLSGDKVSHKHKMLSLQKTYILDELLSWKSGREIVSTEKIDGSSCSLIYRGGSLHLAKTRGDGEFGENITSKIFFIPSIPKNISSLSKSRNKKSEEVEIRGEVYCTQGGFHMISQEMLKLGLEVPNSLRNIVAGVLGRKENIELSRFLSFKAFEYLGDNDNSFIQKESDKLDFLKNAGFTIPKYIVHKNDEEQSSISIGKVLKDTQGFMGDGDYLIDGIVFSYNDLSLHRQLGETAHHPRYKMAFKFSGESKVTKIQEITWQVSRNGVLTPVAEVEPVELSGATISRVTLHNWGVVKDFNLKSGDRIEIERSGEVIPKFIKVEKDGGGNFTSPRTCPSCHEETQEREIRIFCTNEKCPGRNLEFTKYFIKSLGIDDLSTERIKDMYDRGLINSPVDLFKLNPIELVEKLEGYQETLADKVIQSIQSKSQPSLLIFLVSLGLTGGGKSKCEKLLNGLKIHSVDELFELNVEKISTVEGFGQKSALSFIDSLNENKKFIYELIESGVEVKNATYSDEVGVLDGKAFCITGTLTRPRSEIQNWIKSLGGKVVSSVSTKTDYLVCNEVSSSSKYKKAISLDIEIITEAILFNKLS